MIEFEMAEDVKELVEKNHDVKIGKETLDLLQRMHDMDLVMVDMEIDHGIVIKKIELVTPEWIEEHLFGTRHSKAG